MTPKIDLDAARERVIRRAQLTGINPPESLLDEDGAPTGALLDFARETETSLDWIFGHIESLTVARTIDIFRKVDPERQAVVMLLIRNVRRKAIFEGLGDYVKRGFPDGSEDMCDMLLPTLDYISDEAERAEWCMALVMAMTRGDREGRDMLERLAKMRGEGPLCQ